MVQELNLRREKKEMRARERKREREGVWDLEIGRFQERYLAENDDLGKQGGKENLNPNSKAEYILLKVCGCYLIRFLHSPTSIH